MIYDVSCKKCGYQETWNSITVKQYEERKVDYPCPKCKEVGAMENCFTTAPPVQYKGVGWTGAGLCSGNDSQSRLDKELTINDQLAERNDHVSRKAMDKVKRAEDNAAKKGLA